MKSPFADTPVSPVIPEFAFVLHDAEVKKLSLGFDIHI
jgi:hypothetical protein